MMFRRTWELVGAAGLTAALFMPAPGAGQQHGSSPAFVDGWHLMSGMGGNKVYVAPGPRLVAVVTSENFRGSDAHELSDRLFAEYILRAAETPAEASD